MEMIAEIYGPSGKVHYRRPLGDPMIAEAERTPGYSVQIVPNYPGRSEAMAMLDRQNPSRNGW